MKKNVLLLTFFSCLYGNLQAGDVHTNEVAVEADAAHDDEVAIGIGVDVGPGGYAYGRGYYYDDRYCDEDGNCYYGNYDDAYYNDGVVWVGPGWYYGLWFDSEPGFWGWRRNYYWRGQGHRGHHGGHGHRGHGGGGHRSGHRSGHGGGGRHGGHGGGGRHGGHGGGRGHGGGGRHGGHGGGGHGGGGHRR